MSKKLFDTSNKRISWRLVEKSLKNGSDVNVSLVSTGPQAGYTALHFAVLEGEKKLVKKLIKEYKANVNCVSNDGVQPIHLAVLYKHEVLVQILLINGANVDAELTKDLVDKYTENQKWTDNFGDKMTLLTFAIINNIWQVLDPLTSWEADIGIKDKKNKTLLMYAIEYESESTLLNIIMHHGYRKIVSQLINARDNDGLHAVHYLLSPAIFGEFRYNGRLWFENGQRNLTKFLIYANTDFNAMVNGDPDTLLINKAAFRSCFEILEILLDFKVPYSVEAKPFHYFMMPVDPAKYVGFVDDYTEDPMERLERRRNRCLELILEYLVLRRALNLFVHEDDIKLMNKLVVSDPKIRKIINDYEENLINKPLKMKKISCGNKTMTVYDFAVKVFDRRSLKLLAKDDKLVETYDKFYFCIPFSKMPKLYEVMEWKITEACERRQVMNKVEKIPRLLTFIPLPYEIILMVIEYLDNNNLEHFVRAFY